MGREEFIEILQRTLAGSSTSSTVNENIRYYQDYIDLEMRGGRSEEEVLTELGDPRLLAKTILEAKKYEGQNYGRNMPNYDEVYDEDGQSTHEANRSGNGKIYQVPLWLIGIIVVFVLVAVLAIVGSVLSVFLPIIIPVICVFLLINYFSKKG